MDGGFNLNLCVSVTSFNSLLINHQWILPYVIPCCEFEVSPSYNFGYVYFKQKIRYVFISHIQMTGEVKYVNGS